MLYLDTKKNAFFSSFQNITFQEVSGSFEQFCNVFFPNSNEVILINGEMIYGRNGKHSDFSGILLLKWLRIYKRLTNKIIVFGFIPLHYILANYPEDIILMAEGTTYIQAPFAGTHIRNTIDSITHIKEERFTQIYKPFVKADFNIEKIGHSFANEFGLSLMQLMYLHITNKEINIDRPKFSKLDFIKALFLYSLQFNFSSRENIDKINGYLKDAVEKYDPKILYIDDQANLGWDKLLCNIIFGNETHSKFKAISNPNILTEKNIVDKINEVRPNCVLLDLRLKGDEETGLSVEEISGYKLLKKIKTVFPELPVVIISATNKSDNLSVLLKAGAEGLWTKPRVESALNSSFLSDSYLHLIQVLYKSLTKFKTPLDKTIFRLGFVKNKVLPIIDKDFLNKSIFLFDTNYFIYNDTFKYYSRIRYFIMLFNTLRASGNSKRIIICQDVLMELFLHSVKNNKTARQNQNLKRSSKYALNLIIRLMNSGLNIIDSAYFTERKLKDSNSVYEVSDKIEGSYFLTKKKTEFIDFFKDREHAIKVKHELENQNHIVPFYADDTLRLFTNYYGTDENPHHGQDNVYLISNDFASNYNISNYITKNKNPDNFNITFSNIDEGNKKLSSAHLTYKKKNIFRNIFIYSSDEFIKRLKDLNN